MSLTSRPVLYSTNVWLKHHINEQFYGGSHYVWCSEFFDATLHGRLSIGSLSPPSSTPADIYRELKAACDRLDKHSAKIAEQRAGLLGHARKVHADGRITTEQLAEIGYLTKAATFAQWRPLVYVISADRVDSRLEFAPRNKRAGLVAEYIVKDLRPNEFDVLEF